MMRRTLLSVGARLWWLPVLVAVVTSAALDAAGPDPIDIPFFVGRGDVMLSGEWAHTFAPADLQAGPVLLLVLSLLGKLAGLLGVDRFGLIAFAVELGAVSALMAVVGRVVRDRPGRRAAQAGAGVLLVLLGVAHGAFADGHPAQIAIPLLWVLAALDAREGRELRAGLLIGLSGGLELWGVLGVAVLALGRPRRAVAGAGLAATLLVGMLAPFLAAGDFHMFEYRWLVTGGTLATLVLERGERFPWAWRLLQGGASLAAGMALALRLRHSLAAVWAVPLAVVVVRLALDPSLNDWYLQGVQTLALVAAAEVLTGEHVRTVWAARRAARSA